LPFSCAFHWVILGGRYPIYDHRTCRQPGAASTLYLLTPFQGTRRTIHSLLRLQLDVYFFEALA